LLMMGLCGLVQVEITCAKLQASSPNAQIC
jgi:hypothetical protein